MDIRPSASTDAASILDLYKSAFVDEDLSDLLQDLFANQRQEALSLVAVKGGVVLGHIAFSFCEVIGSPHSVWLLGPLAVHPDRQRTGIGTKLIKSGLEQASAKKVQRVCVFGDPNYYKRHGFSLETGISPPFKVPKEWQPGWQSLSLSDATNADIAGTLTVPEFWQKPELWGA